MTNQKTTNRFKKILNIFWYLAAIGVSIFALMFIISATLIGYDVKDQCRLAQQTYSGDCVEALIAQLDDENAAYGTRKYEYLGAWDNSAIAARCQPCSVITPGSSPNEKNGTRSSASMNLKRLLIWPREISIWLPGLWRGTMAISDPFQSEVIEETVILSDPNDSLL